MRLENYMFTITSETLVLFSWHGWLASGFTVDLSEVLCKQASGEKVNEIIGFLWHFPRMPGVASFGFNKNSQCKMHRGHRRRVCPCTEKNGCGLLLKKRAAPGCLEGCKMFQLVFQLFFCWKNVVWNLVGENCPFPPKKRYSSVEQKYGGCYAPIQEMATERRKNPFLPFNGRKTIHQIIA